MGCDGSKIQLAYCSLCTRTVFDAGYFVFAVSSFGDLVDLAYLTDSIMSIALRSGFSSVGVTLPSSKIA